MPTHFATLLDDLRRRTVRMARSVEDMLADACTALFEPGDELAKRVIASDREVDAEEVAIEAEVIRLIALYQPAGRDLRLLCTVLKVNNDLERIADCAVNVAKRARRLNAETITVGRDSFERLCASVRQMLRFVIDAYSQEDATAARRVPEQEEVVDTFHADIVRTMIAEATNTPARMRAHLDTLAAAKNLERIADHATNIGEDIIYLSTGRIVRHRADEGA